MHSGREKGSGSEGAREQELCVAVKGAEELISYERCSREGQWWGDHGNGSLSMQVCNSKDVHAGILAPLACRM